MRKVLLISMLSVIFVSCQMGSGEYVDLGLPSGTLWKVTNENGYYNYEDAVEAYGDNLPSKEQWEELIKVCKWTWKEGRCSDNGYKITGPNGKSIVMSVTGLYYCDGDVGAICSDGNYWSSTTGDLGWAWNLNFDYMDVDTYQSLCCYRYAIRLVQ